MQKRADVDYTERRLLYKLYKKNSWYKNWQNRKEACIRRGIRQGCTLSTSIFNVYIQEAINITQKNTCGYKVEWKENVYAMIC